jgi:hypothetical protein
MKQSLSTSENAVKRGSGHIEFHTTCERSTVSLGSITAISKRRPVGNDFLDTNADILMAPLYMQLMIQE